MVKTIGENNRKASFLQINGSKKLEMAPKKPGTSGDKKEVSYE